MFLIYSTTAVVIRLLLAALLVQLAAGIYPPTFQTILPPQSVPKECHIQTLFEYTIFLLLLYE